MELIRLSLLFKGMRAEEVELLGGGYSSLEDVVERLDFTDACKCIEEAEDDGGGVYVGVLVLDALSGVFLGDFASGLDLSREVSEGAG